MLPSLATLQQELADLHWEIAREVERDLLEGRYHNGRAAVIQIFGRKPLLVRQRNFTGLSIRKSIVDK
jgi:hypothetical protein